jgi:hypothetical protein
MPQNAQNQSFRPRTLIPPKTLIIHILGLLPLKILLVRLAVISDQQGSLYRTQHYPYPHPHHTISLVRGIQ